MKPPEDRYRHDVALFRYGLISDIMALAPGAAQAAALRARAKRAHAIPGSTRCRVAVSTLRQWIRCYRRDGFEGLMPKARSDQARPRRMPPDVIEMLLSIKRDAPELSVRQVIEQARRCGEVPDDTPLPPSTIHRLFAREGLMVQQSQSPQKDMRRFAFRFAGELWQADAMHGPRIADNRGRLRKTYLLAILDDATRVIPYASFAFADNTSNFLLVLREAVTRRGLPARLYVDNGSNFRSRQLAIICARLGIALIHARPYHAAGKGKIERYFRTVRGQFLAPLEVQDIADLDTLNRQFRAWLEGEHHQTPHRGLDGDTPLDCWARSAEQVRYPEPGLDLEQMFLFEVSRKVSKARTVSLHNRIYEVDPVLQGQTVTLRYDPAAPPSRPLRVVHDGKPSGTATLLDLHANTEVRRGSPSLRFGPLDDDPEAP